MTSAGDALASQELGGAPEDRDVDRAARDRSQLDEFLAHLAMQQLLYRLGARRSQEVLAVALSATAVALAIADITVRASASQALLAAVPPFADHWWPPMLGLALSFVCLVLSARQPFAILLGPDPENVRQQLDEAGRGATAAEIQASPFGWSPGYSSTPREPTKGPVRPGTALVRKGRGNADKYSGDSAKLFKRRATALGRLRYESPRGPSGWRRSDLSTLTCSIEPIAGDERALADMEHRRRRQPRTRSVSEPSAPARLPDVISASAAIRRI
jgi:hypothetical protein